MVSVVSVVSDELRHHGMGGGCNMEACISSMQIKCMQIDRASKQVSILLIAWEGMYGGRDPCGCLCSAYAMACITNIMHG